ncbi:MAG: hypothetical protein ACYSTN_09960 [Planctomycetota bacterium]|jgi:hypothetical protein
MVENNNSDKAEQENVDESQKCCPSTSGDKTCCSSASGSYSKRKLVVLVIIVVAAGIILARSLMKESNDAGDDTQQLFAAIGQEENCEISPQINAVTNVAASEETEPTLWGPELGSLVSLNKVAADTDAVFVLLVAEDQQGNQAITREIEAAAKKIQSNGNRICAFKLKKDAPDYAQLAKQFPIPCVVAMVKGRGMSAVSGDINEAKLVGAFVTASRPSGCGPSSSCSPSSCPPTGPRK